MVYTMVVSVDIVYTIQIALHCLDSSMYAYIQLGKIRKLLEWGDVLLKKKWEWTGVDLTGWMDAPMTVKITRAPIELTMSKRKPRVDYSLVDFVTE